MAEEKSINQLVADAEKKMQKIAMKFFTDDPVLLGAWCLVDKIPDPRQKTFGIDSRTTPPSIRFNPNFVNSLPAEYLEAVMASECFKIILKHPTTRLYKPKAISNMASQMTINTSVMNGTVNKKIFDDGVKPNLFQLEENQWLEYYFRELLNNLPKALEKASQMFKKEIKEDDGQRQENGKSEDGKGEKQSKDENGYQKFDKPGDAMKEYFDPSSTSNQDWEKNDLMDADVQNMVNEKKDNTKHWGTYTKDEMGAIIAANTPKISYKDILRRFHNSVLSTKQTSSRMKVNRRYDLQQPGHKRVYKSKLIFAVDASGSMSDDDLKEGFAVINSLCKHSQIEYVLFDTEIKLTEKKMKKAKQSFKISGRGGTDFQEVINYANKHKSDGLIIYTDGCALAPTKPDHTKVMWLLTDKGNKPPVEWGMTATLNRLENVH